MLPNLLHHFRYSRIVFRLALQEVFNYRLNFLFMNIKYVLYILMVGSVWTAVENHAPGTFASIPLALQYFLVVAIFYGFSNFHTWYIEYNMRAGGLTLFLTRPVNVYWYYWVYQFATTLLEVVVKLLILLPILVWVHVSLIFPLDSLLIVSLFLLVGYTFSFTMYFMISSGAVWLTEVFALRFSMNNLMRFFSGIFFPITLLPLVVQNVIWWTPFPHLISTPIAILQHTLSPDQLLPSLAILSIWTLALFVCKRWYWPFVLRAYEGGGL